MRCSTALAAALAERVRLEQAAEKAWWKAHKALMPDDLGPRQQTAWLAAAQAAFEAEVAAGRLRGTNAGVVVPALREEVAARGWVDRRPKLRPVPPGYYSRKARPLGSRSQHWEERVPLHIPDDLLDLVARGSYWTSAPHIAALQRWYKKHGRQYARTRWQDRVWNGAGPSNADLRKRDDLLDAILTPGMVWRAATCRALGVDPAGEVTRRRPVPDVINDE